jgi:predicted amidophosphoribosyltransferase
MGAARAMNVLTTVVRKTIEIVLPAYCVGCGAGGSYLCERCVAHAGAAGQVEINVSELTSDSAVVAFGHTGVARTAVHRLKYTGLRAIAPLMAAPMARVLRRDLAGYTLIPVPLRPRRLRERGFNQAALLASGVGALTAMTVNEGWLRRRTQTGHQADAASGKDRRANVVGAFEAERR